MLAGGDSGVGGSSFFSATSSSLKAMESLDSVWFEGGDVLIFSNGGSRFRLLITLFHDPLDTRLSSRLGLSLSSPRTVQDCACERRRWKASVKAEKEQLREGMVKVREEDRC